MTYRRIADELRDAIFFALCGDVAGGYRKLRKLLRELERLAEEEKR
jgi:hypothetical protein